MCAWVRDVRARRTAYASYATSRDTNDLVWVASGNENWFYIRGASVHLQVNFPVKTWVITCCKSNAAVWYPKVHLSNLLLSLERSNVG